MNVADLEPLPAPVVALSASETETDDPESWAQSQAAVTASFALDPERWTLSHTKYTAAALRRRALAAGNGRDKYTTPMRGNGDRDGASKGAGRVVPRGLSPNWWEAV